MRIIVLTILILSMTDLCLATDTGPNYSGTIGVSGTGDTWSSTSNAVGSTSDDYASVSISVNGATSEYLEFTNFGFDIPDGYDVDGITVEIRWRQSGTKIEDNVIQLIDGGTISGDNNGLDGALPTTATITTYGGSADTWGLSLTEADVEASDFGVAIRLDKQGGGGAETGEVDWVRVTITSTTSSSGSGADSDRQTSAGGTDNSWTPLTNQVATSNDSYEAVTMNKGEQSQYLIVDNFGLSITGTDEILGIEITVERSSSGDKTKDYHIYLVDETGAVRTSGTDQASASIWPTSDGSATYGGSSDLWGESAGFWTPAKLNDADFGVAIAVEYENSGPAGTRTASIDHVTITITSSVPLPVELASFTGVYENGQVELNWQTAAEINNDHFEVQRLSADNNFEVIGVVDGNGNSNTVIDYQFVDGNPVLGLHYYRLKQVDFDGAHEYLPIISVNGIGIDAGVSFAVYPNPAKDLISIDAGPITLNSEIKIFDASGAEIDSGRLIDNRLNIAQLRAGIYFMTLSTSTSIQRHRFIKL